MRTPLRPILTFLLLGSLCRLAAATEAERPPLHFQDGIRASLEAHCFKCHGVKTQKGDINFSVFTDEKSAQRQRKVWRKSIEQIETLEMPPEGQKPMSAEEREKVLRWMKETAVRVDCNDPTSRDPGPTVVRRLSRAEYDLTIRDLLGVEFDSADAVGMPDDTPVHGFSTLGNNLILPPVLMEKYFTAADQLLNQLLPSTLSPTSLPQPAKSSPQQLKVATAALLVATPGDGLSARDAARKVVERLATRAYRRPARQEEVDHLLALYDLATTKGASHEAGVRLMVKAILVSPRFLFRLEEEPPTTQPPQTAYRVTDYELATRLSYFLWSTMPDEALFQLAGPGKLSDPAELERQVKRMLADPKAKALTEQFAVQWLQIRKVETARPSTEFFPTFTPKLRQAMFDETATFFDHLRTDDQSVMDLLDANYTYVNEELAKHYGIEGISGPEMRKVTIDAGQHRGGILGMGSVLALTSHTSRTSPTLRGKYVLEVILGTPPPPPPANAGMLKEDGKKGKEAKTFREQMAMHAADASCASCHKRIDPLGYAMENFDAIGRWRADAGGRPLDNSGQLPTGESFTGPGELKQVLLGRKDQFLRNLTQQMFMYALGREMDDDDECALRDARATLAKGNDRFSALVMGIVTSTPFQYRRASAAAD